MNAPELSQTRKLDHSFRLPNNSEWADIRSSQVVRYLHAERSGTTQVLRTTEHGPRPPRTPTADEAAANNDYEPGGERPELSELSRLTCIHYWTQA